MIKGKEYLDDADFSMSLEEIYTVVQPFGISVMVANKDNEIIWKRENPKKNTNINPSILRLIYDNEHVYLVNQDTKKFDYIKDELADMSEKEELVASAKYRIMDQEKDFLFITGLDDIAAKVKEEEFEEGGYKLCIINTDLKPILQELIFTHDYEPKVNINHLDEIDMINIKIKNLSIGIKSVMNDVSIEEEETTQTTEFVEQQFKEYNNLDFELYQKLINKKNQSNYNPDFAETLRHYVRSAPRCAFTSVENRDHIGIDTIKCYTYLLMQLEKFPVFGQFDNFKEYHQEEIKEYNFYFVQRLHVKNTGDLILLDSTFNVVSGLLLKKYGQQIKIKILYVAEPSRLEENNCVETVKKIYDNKVLNVQQKKNLVNLNVGKLGKTKNMKSISKIFKNQADAQQYKQLVGGEYFTMQFAEKNEEPDLILGEFHTELFAHDKIVSRQQNNQSACLDNNVDDDDIDYRVNEYAPARINRMHDPYAPIAVATQTYKYIYYHFRSSAESILSEGYLPIQLMIYDMLRMHMYAKYLTVSTKYQVVAINTDSLFVKEVFNFTNIDKNAFENIGELLYEVKRAPFQMLENKYIEDIVKIDQKIQREEIHIQDEYDSAAIHELLVKEKTGCIVLGNTPGSGKTTLMKNFLRGKKNMFVTPYNLQASEIRKEGFEAVTLYSMLGLRLTEDGKVEKKETKEIDADYIVFDEIYSMMPSSLHMVSEYMKKHPEKKFFATGDVHQLPPIENLNNISDVDTYYNDIINRMFPKFIMLKINKRHRKEDAEILEAIKVDLFNSDLTRSDIIKKYKLKTFTNKNHAKGFSVCYYNHSVNAMNKISHNKIEVPEGSIKVELNQCWYWTGLKVISNGYFRLNAKTVINTNYTYEIQEINNQYCLLKDIENSEMFSVSISQLVKYFSLNYAGTAHSVQGITKDDDLSIFNINSEHVTNKWFYVALTRNRSLDDVYIHDDQNAKVYLEGLKKHINCKINHYVNEDNKKGRVFQKANYINDIWVLGEMKKNNNCCAVCKHSVTLVTTFENDETCFSIDRIDSNLAHIKSNCQITCVKCNLRLKNSKR